MRSEKGLVMETKLKSQKEAKNVYLEEGVLRQIAREKRREKRKIQSVADPGAELDTNTGVGAGAEKEGEREVRVMTEEEKDLVLKRRKTGRETGDHSQGVGQEREGLGVREERRKEPVKK